MKIEEIKELIQALEQSSLTSLELHQGDTSVKLEKQAPAGSPAPVVALESVTVPSVSETTTYCNAAAAPNPGVAVTSPLVGVFYAAPSPNDAPFVSVGDTVKKGDVLCIVEAMKLMNEITAEADGTITQICAENGQVVEFGQPLFYLA